MDKFTKDKVKQLNKLLATIYYELKHVEHLTLCKHPRSLRAILKQTSKVYKAYVRIKMLRVRIEIVKSTPRPKYPSGGMCGIIDERGAEMVIAGVTLILSTQFNRYLFKRTKLLE